MKEFVNKINMLFVRYNPNVNRMAKVINVDGGIIQRAKAGKNLPTRDTVEKISNYIPMTGSEKDELLKAYDIAKIGKKTYYERLEIKRIMENLSQVSMAESYFDGEDDCLPRLHVDPVKRYVRGTINVNNMLLSVMSDEFFSAEEPHLILSMPFENEATFNVVLHRYLGSRKHIVIEHFMHLYTKYDDYSSANNIRTLAGVLKFAFAGKGEYHPYYNYTDKQDTHDNLILFPYFLMTGRWVVQISGDYKSAILLDDKGLREIFEKHVEVLKAESRQLVQLVPANKIYDIYGAFAKNTYASVELDPCMAQMLTPEVIDAHVAKDIPDRASALKFATQVCGSAGFNKHKSYYAMDGLKTFVETGLMSYMWPGIVIPFTKEERIAFLESMKAEPDLFGMFNPYEITCSGNVEFNFCSDGRVFIATIDMQQIKYCVLEEPGVCDAFLEFIDSLDDSPLVLKREKQVEIIDECLEKLRDVGDVRESK